MWANSHSGSFWWCQSFALVTSLRLLPRGNRRPPARAIYEMALTSTHAVEGSSTEQKGNRQLHSDLDSSKTKEERHPLVWHNPLKVGSQILHLYRHYIIDINIVINPSVIIRITYCIFCYRNRPMSDRKLILKSFPFHSFKGLCKLVKRKWDVHSQHSEAWNDMMTFGKICVCLGRGAVVSRWKIDSLSSLGWT